MQATLTASLRTPKASFSHRALANYLRTTKTQLGRVKMALFTLLGLLSVTGGLLAQLLMKEPDDFSFVILGSILIAVSLLRVSPSLYDYFLVTSTFRFFNEYFSPQSPNRSTFSSYCLLSVNYGIFSPVFMLIAWWLLFPSFFWPLVG